MPNKIKAYLYRSDDRKAKLKSSSGAAFFEIAKKALDDGYYICGCVWDDSLVARHIVSRSEKDLHRMQGSKYVQSKMGDTYREILLLLKNGNKVLFSGTPCQASAISILASTINQRDKLLTVAVICHGVPSPLAWESYKEWTNRKENDTLTDVNFRDKTQEGYKKSYTRYAYKSGKNVVVPSFLPTNKYMETSIVYNLPMRQSCTDCMSKGYNDNIDIILGDWYSEYMDEGSLGTSCICAYTYKGDEYIKKNLFGLRTIDYSEIVKENSLIEQSINSSPNRERFFANVKDYKSWDNVEKLYPPKYPIKKLFVKTGLYNLFKGKI
ncbi:MAG: Coenzyme F420 hydrogenase/dehydrogenase, beta subunit C-terminal domain [Roseburia sp.]